MWVCTWCKVHGEVKGQLCALWWVLSRGWVLSFHHVGPWYETENLRLSDHRAISPVQAAILNKLPEQRLHTEKLDACANSARSPMCSRNYQKRAVVLKRERSVVFLHDRTCVPHRPHPYITLGWFTSRSRSHIRPKGLQRPLQAQWPWECNIPSLKVPYETMLVTYPLIQGHLTGLELFHIYYTNTAEQTVSLLDGDTAPIVTCLLTPIP